MNHLASMVSTLQTAGFSENRTTTVSATENRTQFYTSDTNTSNISATDLSPFTISPVSVFTKLSTVFPTKFGESTQFPLSTFTTMLSTSFPLNLTSFSSTSPRSPPLLLLNLTSTDDLPFVGQPYWPPVPPFVPPVVPAIVHPSPVDVVLNLTALFNETVPRNLTFSNETVGGNLSAFFNATETTTFGGRRPFVYPPYLFDDCWILFVYSLAAMTAVMCLMAAFTCVFNLYVVGISFTPAVTGAYKYMLVLVSFNNSLTSACLCVTLVPYMLIMLDIWLLPPQALYDLCVFVYSAMYITVSVYQLELTATKVLAVYWPLDYAAHMTPAVYRALSGGSLLVLYPLLYAGYARGRETFYGTEPYNAAIVCLWLNIVANLFILKKLRASVQSEQDVVMRQAIRANYVQAIIPFLITVPAQIAALFSYIEQQLVFSVVIISILFIDPVSVVGMIGMYRKASQVLPRFVKYPVIFILVSISLLTVLLFVFTLIVPYCSSFM